MTPLPVTGSMLPLVAAEIYDARPDLAAAWPNARTGENPDGFWRWINRYGGVEFQIDHLLTFFRRSLTSDSLVGFTEEITALMPGHGGTGRFLGEDRRTSADWLRTIGRDDLANSLLETEPEWAFFTDLGAILLIYEPRLDLQKAFPDIFAESHDLFAIWLQNHSGAEHNVQPIAIEQFKARTADTVLAGIFSFLSRREDLGQLARDGLLDDKPDRLMRELIRCSGD
jgi:hypothetical protein